MTEPPRIMVVEDDQDLRENLRELLELEGYRVEAVGSGRAALEALGRGPPPALVLADLMMPGMGGRELVAALRRDPTLAGLKVVLVSGSPAGAERLEVDAVLGKPFGVAELLRLVGRLLPAAGDAPPP